MDTLVTADDVTHGKPHPDPYLRAAHLLGVDPTRCVVFEDAPSGLAAGRAAGCVTVGLPGTHALADLTADVLLPSLEAIQVVSTEEGLCLALPCRAHRAKLTRDKASGARCLAYRRLCHVKSYSLG